ncbi:hypothetical protein VTK26DRAFT_7632 [Humicola hyalothermophila]
MTLDFSTLAATFSCKELLAAIFQRVSSDFDALHHQGTVSPTLYPCCCCCATWKEYLQAARPLTPALTGIQVFKAIRSRPTDHAALTPPARRNSDFLGLPRPNAAKPESDETNQASGDSRCRNRLRKVRTGIGRRCAENFHSPPRGRMVQVRALVC